MFLITKQLTCICKESKLSPVCPPPCFRLNLRRCRSAISENDLNTLTPPSCPALNRASRHRLPDVTFTHLPVCQRRRGPGPDAAVHIAPACYPCLGSARLGLTRLCPSSRQLARIKSGERGPSFCTVTSERISDAQSAFTNTADAGAADTHTVL